MAAQLQRYTCAITGQAVTLTPKAGSESKPNYQGNSTVVVNTTATTPDPGLWNINDEYLVTIERLTKG